jgi:hypothetical protein
VLCTAGKDQRRCMKWMGKSLIQNILHGVKRTVADATEADRTFLTIQIVHLPPKAPAIKLCSRHSTFTSIISDTSFRSSLPRPTPFRVILYSVNHHVLDADLHSKQKASFQRPLTDKPGHLTTTAQLTCIPSSANSNLSSTTTALSSCCRAAL